VDREIDLSTLAQHVDGHCRWLSYIDSVEAGRVSADVHLAVFQEPYLSFVLNGQKTVESRFSRIECAPYRQVHSGDIILVKQSGGPVRAITQAAKIAYFDFQNDSIERVKTLYGAGICGDDEFWESQRSALFATIIELCYTITIKPFDIPKRDRRGWVPLDCSQRSFSF
jgi:ASC-1-like (ASCH) protein